MKNQFIIIVLFSFVFGQFSTNVLNGFGNSDRITTPASESMGGMWIYNNKSNGFNPLLSSSMIIIFMIPLKYFYVVTKSINQLFYYLIGRTFNHHSLLITLR